MTRRSQCPIMAVTGHRAIPRLSHLRGPQHLAPATNATARTFCAAAASRALRRKCVTLEMNIRVWNALLMPTVRSTKPNPDEQIPVALAARIVGIDRSSLAHLRSEEHTSELQSRGHLVCRLLLEKKN